MAAPTISVIVPVYNGSRTLAASIRSLLAQTYRDIEIVVVNDGSKDDSATVIASFDDARIRSFSQENRGLAETLNRGIELAQGRYIARLDQDDLSLPDRLARQFNYMEAHPRVALLGTWARIYQEDKPSNRYHRHPTSSDTLQLELLLDNPFVHSSILMRTDVAHALGGYHVERMTRFPEDYEFWSRIAAGHEVANLSEVLTIYREVPGSITRTAGDEILANVVGISTRNFIRFTKGQLDEDTCTAFVSLYHGIPFAGEKLSGAEALALWEQAATTIGGSPREWSGEFRASYSRILRRLRTQLLKRTLPRGAVATLQRARNLLRA